MTLNRLICPPFGSCAVDYGFLAFAGRRRRVLFPAGVAALGPAFNYIFHSANDIDVSAPIRSTVSVIEQVPSGGYTGQSFGNISFGGGLGVLNAATSAVTFHLIGGGQAGFNGTVQTSINSVPGGLGGEGGSYSSITVSPGANNFTIQIGDGGAASGGAGTDTWVKNNGIIIALARGGASATPNVGTNIQIGGLGPARTTMTGFPIGMGGGGGGGAGGPNGPGGNGGDISPLQKRQSNPAITTSGGGTGGGAGNGGKPGFTAAFAGTLRNGINSLTGATSGFVPGDPGDQLAPLGTVLVNGGTVYGSTGFFGYGGGGDFGGGGGQGGNSADLTVNNYVDCTPWPANFPGPPYAINQRATATTFDGGVGGVGTLWGILPQDFTTTISQTFLNGFFAGPGGGGGAGAGGGFSGGAGFKRGRLGGPYGGGGGGGGNSVTGNAAGVAGAGYCGLIVAVFH